MKEEPRLQWKHKDENENENETKQKTKQRNTREIQNNIFKPNARRIQVRATCG